MSAFILDSFQVHIYDPWLLCFLLLPLLLLPLFCMVLLFLWSEGKVLVTQLYLTFCDPMDYSSPGSMGFSKIPFSTGFLRPKDWTRVSCIAGRFLTVWATREAFLFFYVVPKGRFPAGLSPRPTLVTLQIPSRQSSQYHDFTPNSQGDDSQVSISSTGFPPAFYDLNIYLFGQRKHS